MVKFHGIRVLYVHQYAEKTPCQDILCHCAYAAAKTERGHYDYVPWRGNDNPVLQYLYDQQHESCLAGVTIACQEAKFKATAGKDRASSPGALTDWIMAKFAEKCQTKLYVPVMTANLSKGAPPEGYIGKPVLDEDAGQVLPFKSPVGGSINCLHNAIANALGGALSLDEVLDGGTSLRDLFAGACIHPTPRVV